jgi:hypothetical protein
MNRHGRIAGEVPETSSMGGRTAAVSKTSRSNVRYEQIERYTSRSGFLRLVSDTAAVRFAKDLRSTFSFQAA